MPALGPGLKQVIVGPTKEIRGGYMGAMSTTNDYIHTGSNLAYGTSNEPLIPLLCKGFWQANITPSTFLT